MKFISHDATSYYCNQLQLRSTITNFHEGTAFHKAFTRPAGKIEVKPNNTDLFFFSQQHSCSGRIAGLPLHDRDANKGARLMMHCGWLRHIRPVRQPREGREEVWMKGRGREEQEGKYITV